MSIDNLIRKGLAKLGFTGRIASATATNGTAIDCTGYGEAFIIISTGTVTGTSVTIDVKIQEDDNSGFSSATDITGAAITQLDEDSDDVIRVGRIDLSNVEQYIRPVITTAGTSPVVPISVIVVLGNPSRSLGSGVGYTAAEFAFDVNP